MYRLTKFTNAIREADDIHATGRAIISSFAELGFEQMCLSTNKASVAELTEQPDIRNLPDACISEYISGGMRNIDFILARGLSLREPFWFTVKSGSENKEDNRFTDFLLSHGISAGFFLLSPPLNGFFSGGGCMMRTDKKMAHNKENLMLASALANISLMKLDIFASHTTKSVERAPYLNQLSQLQIDLLQWASEGKSNTDLAVILGVTRAAVDYHFRMIFKKMGVCTKMQAIALFCRGAKLR